VTDIAGEQAFRAGKAAHISGIVARGNVLQIRLVRADGAFLTAISMPWFCPVPPSLPIRPDAVTGPVPSDGPYYVASSTSDRTVLLRNPNYAGGRPRRPARIVFENGIATPQAVALADRGSIDYLPTDFSNSSLLAVAGALDQRYGPGSLAAGARDQRYLHSPQPGWDGIVLNASRPLFRDARMRRAVEYALDRRALAAAFDDLPSDQIVPPAVPGFGRAHRYPLGKPELETARSLAGGRHRRAVLYLCTNGVFGSPGQERVAVLVRTELARIGIAVTITEPSCAPNNRYDARSQRADLVLASVFGVQLDPEPFVAQVLRRGSLGSALGPGLWTQPGFLARVRSASGLHGDARRVAFLRLEHDLLLAAPVAVYGSYYGGDYFSPRVRCRVVPPGVGAIDLGLLCKR
jgi:ABC-type transport system substrate-binding protein